MQEVLTDHPDIAFAVNLCLEELIINTFVHGLNREPGHHIDVVLAADHRWLTAEISDDAPPFNPFSQAPVTSLHLAASERPIGGLGIHLVRKMMDSAEWQGRDGGNRITLRKALPTGAAEDRPD